MHCLERLANDVSPCSVFFFLVLFVLVWLFRPDITVMVDWALKINYLSCFVVVVVVVVCVVCPSTLLFLTCLL